MRLPASAPLAALQLLLAPSAALGAPGGAEVLASGGLLGELSMLDASMMKLQIVQFASSGTRTMGWKLKDVPSDGSQKATATAYVMDSTADIVMALMNCGPVLEAERPFLEPNRTEPLSCRVPNLDGMVTWQHYKQVSAAIWFFSAGREQQTTSVAMVGLGGGVVPRYLRENCPWVARVDAAEIEPRVVEYAKKFYEVKPDDRFGVFVQGGLEFLEAAADGSYDVFFNDASGSQLDFLTPWTLRLIRSKLRPGGIIIVNAFDWQRILPDWARTWILDLAAPFFAEIRCAVDVIVFFTDVPPPPPSDAALPEHVRKWHRMRPWQNHSGWSRAHVYALAVATACCMCLWCCVSSCTVVCWLACMRYARSNKVRSE